MYISRRESEGGLLSSPRRRRSPNTCNGPLSTLLNNFPYPHKMDHFNYADSDPASFGLGDYTNDVDFDSDSPALEGHFNNADPDLASALNEYYVGQYVGRLVDAQLAAERAFTNGAAKDILWCSLPDSRNILESTVDSTTGYPAGADCGERCNIVFVRCCLTLELQNRWLQPLGMPT